MKKYFMKGTDDEIKFGEELELDFAKKTKHGTIRHNHLECVFVPELVEQLLEDNIIEVREEEEPKEDKMKKPSEDTPKEESQETEEEPAKDFFDELSTFMDTTADLLTCMSDKIVVLENRVSELEDCCDCDEDEEDGDSVDTVIIIK